MRAGFTVAVTLLCIGGLARQGFAETMQTQDLSGSKIVPLSVLTISGGGDSFGGLSGLEVDVTGSELIAVSDDGILYTGRIQRSGTKQSVSNVSFTSQTRLRDATGKFPDEKKLRDYEGLARSADGSVFISVEQSDLLYSLKPGQNTPRARALPVMPGGINANNGYEALAVAANGDLYVLPESTPNIARPFALFRLARDQDWENVFDVPRAGGFKPVGADFGPDGHLYILLRAFSGFGFAARIEVVTFENGRPQAHHRLFSGRYGQFDNLEGLATWTDAGGNLRLLAISDDNFNLFQSNQLVEFILQQ